MDFSAAIDQASTELDGLLALADDWDAGVAREVQLLTDVADDWDLWAGAAALEAQYSDEPEPDAWYEDADELQPVGSPPVDWESAYDYRDAEAA